MRFLSDWRIFATITAGLFVALGVSAGPATAQTVDHFTCYKAKTASGTPKFTEEDVHVIDALRNSNGTVKKPNFLCAPADKNGEDPTAPAHPNHIESYQFKPLTKFTAVTNQQVVDQLGSHSLDIKKPTHLMVPTAKSLAASPPPLVAPALDHFQCYQVKGSKGSAKFVKQSVAVEDQFGTMTVTLNKPTHLCIPVDKNDEEPGAGNHAGHLLCYQAKQTSQPKFAALDTVYTANQFGAEALAVTKPYEVCLPAIRPGIGLTPTPTVTVTPTPTVSATPTGTATPTATRTPMFPCGNEVIDGGEECDGNAPSACPGTCTIDCTCPVCGDNSTNQPNEECDGSDDAACPGFCQSNCGCPGTCDPLDPSVCLFPLPNDYFTVVDPTTDTGRRVHFAVAAMPKNNNNVSVNPADYNLNDGFSPGNSILLHVPNVDLVMTDAAPITDIERSLDSDSPTVIVNATTLAHHLHWAELDANATSEPKRALIMRPGINYDDGARYIVALRNMKDSSGTLIPPSAEFLAFRDNIPTANPATEARRPHMEDLFTTLAAAGVPRNDLYLAWDFTVSSTRSLTERMLFVRDDGFSRLGAAAPSFTVTSVQDEVDANIFRIIKGTFNVERYVNSTTPPARFTLDANGLPIHQATPQVADFQCNIPRAALANAGATAVPARASIYGHGLLGSYTEVGAGNVRSMGQEHNFVFCATDWIGMANADIGTAVAILQEASKFPSLTDRLQQSFLDQLFLARLMIHANGFVSDPAFKDSMGNPVIDTSNVYFDGNSQGGIFGGAIMAIAQDITRGVLGVPGMNYSLLLTRSTDFAGYSAILYPAYPNEIERPLILSLLQMLWDRSDPNGYASHLTGTRAPLLPGTPAHKVLLHEAFGDFQVSNYGTEVEIRTLGGNIYQPALAPGRHTSVNPYSGIPAIPSFPFDGTALVVWDSGTAPPPTTNTAPSVGADPHSKPRSNVDARTQKSEFLKPPGVGAVVDVCAGAPCLAP